MRRFFVYLLVLIISTILLLTMSVSATDIVIGIDPGHGGSEYGAVYEYNGLDVYEKDLNLQISQYVKHYLEEFDVTVYMTREDDKYIDVDKRIILIEGYEPDMIISIHNNSFDSPQAYGSEVIVPAGTYRSMPGIKAQQLGEKILVSLNKLGLYNRGVVTRLGDMKYENGQRADYYAVIRDGVNADIPTFILECAFLSNASDYQSFLSDDEKLNNMSKAIADTVLEFYGINTNTSVTASPEIKTESTNEVKKKEDTVSLWVRYKKYFIILIVFCVLAFVLIVLRVAYKEKKIKAEEAKIREKS